MKTITKTISIIILLLAAIFCLCACSEQDVKTYKGLNSEEVIDIAQYGVQRIMEAENVYGDTQAVELTTERVDAQVLRYVYLIVIGDTVFVYEYNVSETGTVDDTWARQSLVW